MKKQLNTTLTYVLSIIGLLCCCIGGFGFLLSGPAFLIAHNKIKDAKQNPDDYEGNFNAMNTAKIVALIILIINLLYLFYNIYLYSTGGFDDVFLEFQEAMKEIEKNN
ncbi:MAG: hypothetical protein HON66_02750 [Formosa sp.]|jgi:hypothetical protein|nr:hypothetical protein [Formosa sp.]MDA9646543.1 CCC motif membrane protein [Flavobacteriaceae bacterium]MDC0382136.1 CCC motif membrane protein [Flavobacteriaceae bacterium]|tara:strand:+ start:8216 stop:8539 length:324 start_codon:yes stop_codon:yes gene_type:complete